MIEKRNILRTNKEISKRFNQLILLEKKLTHYLDFIHIPRFRLVFSRKKRHLVTYISEDTLICLLVHEFMGEFSSYIC